MPSGPPENIGDMLRLYQDQLELKDAHIAALTNLLKEANARLAQQQRISEGMLAVRSGAAVSVAAPADRPPLRGEPPEDVTSAVVDQRLNKGDSEPYSHAIAADYSENHGKELAFASVAVPEAYLITDEEQQQLASASVSAPQKHEIADEEQEEEPLPSSPIKPLAMEAVGADSTTAPIPMSYFGPPIANLASNLKEATAESEPVALSEIREPDEEKYVALRKRLAEARTKADQTAPPARWQVPVLAAAVVILAGVAFIVPWKKLLGHSNATVARLSKTGPALGPALPQNSSVQPTPPHTSEGLPAGLAASTPAGGGSPDASRSGTAPNAVSGPSPSPASATDAQLVEAVSQSKHKLVRQMLDKGANVNARNEHQSSVLAMAASRGSSEIVDLLLAHGADVNAANDKGWTALMLAVNDRNLPSRRRSIVEALLKHGAHTDAVNSQGTSALMMAAQVGDKSIVSRLLDAGAPALTKNSSGLTAQDLAILKHNSRIAAILAKAVAIQP